ncbi:dihydroneopterin aldolase [Sulfurovum sp.]|uniref:dihydroneopterin aldolase n=1 Tax=Sulfurovum sp. TaxID=1969726 RepID=UPI002867FB35|nr:dihydroneopterin aldolase [Sulfurovum sp.]
MTVHIEELTFDVIIGLLDFERDKPQRVIINLEVSYEYSDDQFIDYADIVLLIQNELKEKRYTLLENALLGLKDILYTTYPNLQTLWVKISKPDILPKCTVSLSKTWHF